MRRDLLKRFMAVHGQSRASAYADSVDAQQLESVSARVRASGGPPPALNGAHQELLSRVVRLVERGELELDFRPPADDSVTVAPLDDPMHLQSLLYWTVRLRKPMARVLEACRRAGDGATIKTVLATIRKIENEDRFCQTDKFFAMPSRS